MLKRLCLAAFALMALGLVHRTAAAKVLSLGDPAPPIVVKKFVKGTPVTSFEKGKLYVVEFWATWCGPCKESIPHLTEMAKKFKDVTFVGVSVWEQSQTAVEPFVTSMGDKMNYHVAMDSVPAGKDGNTGVMATTWMAAAQQDGIPTAFVVNKESKIVWIGHPMEMEEPLTKVVAGTWDLQTAALEAAKKQKMQTALQDLGTKIQPLLNKKDFAGALDAVNKGLAATPDLEDELWQFKLSLLLNLNRESDAVAYGTKLVDTKWHENAGALNEFAWSLVNPENPKKSSPAMVNVAMNAAIRADALSKGEDPAIADTLARAYFAAGKKDLAVSTEERAIKHSTDSTMTVDFNKSLAEFKK